MKKLIRISSVALLLALLTPSCVTNRAGNYLPSHTVEFVELDGESLENSNRTVHSFNKGTMEYVVSPLAHTWKTITPECVRRGIINFVKTLSYPLQLVTHALTADFDYCWTDTQRFVINVTAGGLGFCDLATDWGYPYIKGGFDGVFATWGIGGGAELNMPLLGPSNTRGVAGAICDMPLDPLGWFLPFWSNVAASSGFTLNQTSEDINTYDELFGTHSQSYEIAKFGTSLRNAAFLNRYTIDYNGKKYSADDSFGFTQLKPSGRLFFSEIRQYKAALGNGCLMPYSSWPRKNSDRLVILLPGIGGHRNSAAAWALAEMYHSHGCAVIALSSTLHDDYFANTGSDAPSGFLPEDAKRLATVINAVVEDFCQRYPDTSSKNAAIVGYSLGALNALHIAALENGKAKDAPLFRSLKVQRYVAINPPSNPMYALVTIDKFFNIPAKWPEGERSQRLWDLKMRLSACMNPDFRNPKNDIVPFTLEESHFLIGLSMRLALAESVQMQQKYHNTGVLNEDVDGYFFRNNLFAETLGFSFDDYVNKIVIPYYQKHGYGNCKREELGARCRLTAIEKELSNDSRIMVFHNKNDFLITPADCKWYERTFQKRLLWFERGGHLGNVFMPDYQKALYNATF